MQAYARFLVQRRVAWAVVLVTMALAMFGMGLAFDVEHEDDLLAFLPEGNAEVSTFFEVNERFGGLDLAIVGLRPGDVFDPAFLTDLTTVTQELDRLPGLAHVLSITNVEDFVPDPVAGGIVTGYLVANIPASPEERAQLRRKVLSRDHVVGNLVSADGRAVLIFCALAQGADPRTMAEKIRAAVHGVMPDVERIEGGNPFISSYIYNTTQKDMRQLTPWAVAVIVLILLIVFQDAIGSFLALLSTGIGILAAIGTMTLVGEPFNLVLGGMPVILFAVGSAYSIHVLSRYYAMLRLHERTEALVRTLVGVGPTVIAAGLTTVAGLVSFVFMDIRPLRTFGLFTALGILATLVLSLTFVPAAVALLGLAPKRRSLGAVGADFWRQFARRCHHNRRVVTVALVLVAAAAAMGLERVDSRMEPRSFYAEGSPPDRADDLLSRDFGGSQFVQLHVRGDLKDPLVLREVRHLSDLALAVPGVTQVVHVGQAIARANEAMEGEARIPDHGPKVGMLFGFLSGQPSIDQLVTADRDEALVHIKVDAPDAAGLEEALGRIESLVEREVSPGYRAVRVETDPGEGGRARRAAMVSTRVAAVDRRYGVEGRPVDRGVLARGLARGDDRVDRPAVSRTLARFLRSDEALVELPAATKKGDPAVKVAQAVAALGPEPVDRSLEHAVAQALGKPESDVLVEDLLLGLAPALRETWRKQRALAAAAALLEDTSRAAPEGPRGVRYRGAIATALLDLESPSVLLPDAAGDRKLDVTVTGLPVLHRGLSQSVTRNQWRSLAFALVVVFVIMVVLFRSLGAGLLATTPTALTLVVIYGSMGAMDIHLDIGTSMLASLIIGAGVDYAVHLMAAWHAPDGSGPADGAATAGARTGPAIWTNGLAVCAGFFVLTLGDARPLQNVGGLTAAAMVTAALATFLAIPALARRRTYARESAELVWSPPGEAAPVGRGHLAPVDGGGR